jgi:hypothetical protein
MIVRGKFVATFVPMKFLYVLVGIVAGALAVILIPALQPAHSKLAATQVSLGQKDAEIQRLQTQVTQVETEKQEARRAQDDMLHKIVGLEEKLKAAIPAQPASNPILAMAAGMLKQKGESQIEALKTRLNLTPEQETELRRHFDEAAKFQEDITNALLSGKKLTSDEMKQRASSQVSLDETLKKLLSPDQMKSYQEFQKVEKSEQSDLMAHIKMNEISSVFALDEDQKDKIYGIFYDQQNFKPELKGVDPQQIPLEGERQRHEFLKAQLKTILTPEQLETWSKGQEAQMKAQQEMMQKFLPAR